MSGYQHVFDSRLKEVQALARDPRQREKLYERLGRRYPGASSGSAFQTEGRIHAHFVFQGGGILGIAHLGFYRAMEVAGIRPVGLAGTSAGAILAVLIAAARGATPDKEVGEELLSVLWAMPTESFIDGPYTSRRLIKSILATRSLSNLEMTVPFLSTVQRLFRHFGINRGVLFEEWLTTVLANHFDINSIGELKKAIATVAEVVEINASADQLFKIIATALPVLSGRKAAIGVKLVFPQDLSALSSRYWASSPAKLARMSMSVPLFFEPAVFKVDPLGWAKFLDTTFRSTLHRESRNLLSEATDLAFVDGGLLSNFPIDAFRRSSDGFDLNASRARWISSIPTIGSTLVANKVVKEGGAGYGAKALLHYAASVIDGMRHVRDRDAIRAAATLENVETHSTPYICPIDVGGHNWLNFQLSESDQADLYLRGISAGHEFLKSLDE